MAPSDNTSLLATEGADGLVTHSRSQSQNRCPQEDERALRRPVVQFPGYADASARLSRTRTVDSEAIQARALAGMVERLEDGCDLEDTVLQSLQGHSPQSLATRAGRGNTTWSLREQRAGLLRSYVDLVRRSGRRAHVLSISRQTALLESLTSLVFTSGEDSLPENGPWPAIVAYICSLMYPRTLISNRTIPTTRLEYLNLVSSLLTESMSDVDETIEGQEELQLPTPPDMDESSVVEILSRADPSPTDALAAVNSLPSPTPSADPQSDLVQAATLALRRSCSLDSKNTSRCPSPELVVASSIELERPTVALPSLAAKNEEEDKSRTSTEHAQRPSGYISDQYVGRDAVTSPRPLGRYTPTFLAAGNIFEGKQESDRQKYNVRVEIKHVDMEESFLCGFLRIEGLTADHPTLTTYFEGEIIGPKYSFSTRHPDWGSSERQDMLHWNKFAAWRPLAKAARATDFHFKNATDRDHIFMRWKEYFLVPDHRVRSISGASFEGFYYICFNQRQGTFDGIYYHSKSERFQKLVLEHVGRPTGCMPAVEMR